ncbi:hypothetical protein D3C86_2146860 [compost metagenome]
MHHDLHHGEGRDDQTRRLGRQGFGHHQPERDRRQHHRQQETDHIDLERAVIVVVAVVIVVMMVTQSLGGVFVVGLGAHRSIPNR